MWWSTAKGWAVTGERQLTAKWTAYGYQKSHRGT